MEAKLCRLCCKNEGSIFIFQKECTDIKLSAKIMYCCRMITIKEEDGLPPCICLVCDKELETCYKFILNCEAADKQHRSQALSVIAKTTVGEIKSDSPIPVEIKSEITDNVYDDHYSDDIPLECLRQDVKYIKTENTKNFKTKSTKKKNKCTKSLLKCSECNKQCNNQSALTIHMRTHTDNYLFPCPMCDKKYKDRSNLIRHRNRHHSGDKRNRNYICESCGKGFFSKHDVMIHMRTHTGETPYICTYCPAKFTQIGALLRHKKHHNGKKDHMCSVCSKMFWTKVELKMHSAVHSTEKKYSCPICNTMFKQQNNLTKHLKLHSENRNFICNYCGKNFKFKGNLKLHIEKLHSEKSGYCATCLRHVPDLEAHMWKHTGERPLKCDLCPSSFFNLKALGRHINFKHTKTDKFKCNYEGCVMTFPSRPMLDFHFAKIHSSQIPFPCDRCTRAFYRKNDLARHKIGTHKERLS